MIPSKRHVDVLDIRTRLGTGDGHVRPERMRGVQLHTVRAFVKLVMQRGDFIATFAAEQEDLVSFLERVELNHPIIE